MRKIHIGLFKNSNEKNNKKYITHILNQGNSLITIPLEENTDDKLNKIILKGEPIYASFRSNFDCYVEKIKICFHEFDLSYFCEGIKSIVDITFENVKDLSDEPFDSSKIAKTEIVSLIENVIFKFKYNEPIDLIYLISDIFKNVLTSHKLKNGNKRMSSMLLANMLYMQGIFLKGSLKYSRKEFWKVNEEKFIKYIEKYDKISTSSNFNEENQCLLLEIYNWLYHSIYISLNFSY